MEHTFPSATAPLAIVQWTHTLVMKPMLLLAREQILRSSFAEHHVVLSSCGDSEPCSTLLQKAWPLVDNVTCTNATDVVNALPAFTELRSVFNHNYGGAPGTFNQTGWCQPNENQKRTGCKTHPLEIGERGWCWHSCDAPYLLWYHLLGRTLHHVHFFWFLEWDVVWTGDVTTVLSAWSALHEPFHIDRSNPVDVANPSRRVPPGSGDDVYDGRRLFNHDLLCPNPSWAVRAWIHRKKRNVSIVNHTFVHRCVTEVYRLTHRLLGAMLEMMQQPQAAMFCEMRASSVCAMNSWCTMRSLFDRDRLHLFYTAKRHRQGLVADLGASATAPSAAEIAWARTRWVNSYKNDGGVPDAALQRLDRPMLYHAYKWKANRSASLQVPSFAHRLHQVTTPFEEALQQDLRSPSVSSSQTINTRLSAMGTWRGRGPKHNRAKFTTSTSL